MPKAIQLHQIVKPLELTSVLISKPGCMGAGNTSQQHGWRPHQPPTSYTCSGVWLAFISHSRSSHDGMQQQQRRSSLHHAAGGSDLGTNPGLTCTFLPSRKCKDGSLRQKEHMPPLPSLKIDGDSSSYRLSLRGGCRLRARTAHFQLAVWAR